MESEIQFLLSIVLKYKVPEALRTLCLERIGKIEENLRTNQKTQPVQAQVHTVSPSGVVQAPSMQRILDGMNPVNPPPTVIPPPSLQKDKETGLLNVTTSVTAGGSTRGPSKNFR